MVVVIDNSLLIPLFIDDEDSSQAEEVFSDQRLELHAPPLLYSEFGNVMLVCLRQKRLIEEDISVAYEALNDSGILFSGPANLSQRKRTHELAMKHQLSYYDATYLSLALEKKGTIATLDKQLIKAARLEKCLWEKASC